MAKKNPETGMDICECVDCTNPKAEPYPLVMSCPNCGLKHVDKVDPTTGIDWVTKKHHTHRCVKWETVFVGTIGDEGTTLQWVDRGCGYEWTPSLVHTVGVEG
jgi:hypothetical protein